MDEKKRIGKYPVVGQIGEGGMGKVYKAIHPTLKRHVVIKQVSSRAGKAMTQRFQREANIMLSFRHDNIVPVYDHFREGAYYYIAMEFVNGLSLDELIAQKKQITPSAALVITNEISKGLKYAHDRGVIHRDIKPANVLISNKGEVKLADFGIATSLEESEEDITRTGVAMGTPAFMSPEQISDAKRVDKRSDIYSMGVMLYQMLTGQKPFPGTFSTEAIQRISKGKYVNPRKLNPGIPRAIKNIIKNSMHHKVRRRYKDLQNLMDSMARYAVRLKSQSETREEIRKYLSKAEEAQSLLSAPVKKKAPVKRVVLAAICTLAVVAGIYFAYTNGLYYEFLKSREYGSLEIKAMLPKEYHKAMEHVYAAAALRYLDAEEGQKASFQYILKPEMKTLKLPVLQNQDKVTENEKANLVTSKKLYLRAGNYALDMSIENRKYFTTFYLDPRIIQKTRLDTHLCRIMQFDLEEQKSKPISLSVQVYDEESDRSIYDLTKISFKDEESKWMDWKNAEKYPRIVKNILQSGKRYTFKFDAAAYYSQTVSFDVEKILDSGHLNVYLLRKPGKLIIESDTEELKLLIDNNRENYLGEQKKEFVQYGDTIEGQKEFFLSTGNYILTVMKSKKNLKNHTFAINDSTLTIIHVKYDAESEKIEIY